MGHVLKGGTGEGGGGGSCQPVAAGAHLFAAVQLLLQSLHVAFQALVLGNVNGLNADLTLEMSHTLQQHLLHRTMRHGPSSNTGHACQAEGAYP